MKRILFVDDDANILMGLRRSLRGFRNEWEMVFAEGGAAALGYCAAAPFDAVVSDVRMPGMEGTVFLGEVMRLCPDTVRLILSGQCSRSTVLKCVEVAHQFLSKPCETATLTSAVRKLCEVRDSFRDMATRNALTRSWMAAEPSGGLRRTAGATRVRERFRGNPGGDHRPGRCHVRKVLQLVNSGFFGTPQRVTNAAHAARLLGLDTINSLVDSAVFQPCAVDGRETVLQSLNRHSFAVARAAKKIAETMSDDCILIRDSYLAGMLHEVGTLALDSPDAQCRVETNGATAHQVNAGCQSPAGHCAKSGMDPGGYLMALWGLPDAVVQAIAYHRIPASRQEQALRRSPRCMLPMRCWNHAETRRTRAAVRSTWTTCRKLAVQPTCRNWHQICAARQLEGVLQ